MENRKSRDMAALDNEGDKELHAKDKVQDFFKCQCTRSFWYNGLFRKTN